jgi:hypothetical protein
MPANATTHRPPVAVSYGDSPRREQQQPMQGEAFRSALDSIEQPAASARTRAEDAGEGRSEAKARRRDDARAAERRDDARAADRRDEARTADRRDDARTAERRDDARAAERRNEQAERQTDRSGRQDKPEAASDEPRLFATSGNKVQETTGSSGGGFGSDPPVSELSEAGGSVRTVTNPGLPLAGPPRGVEAPLPAATQPRATAATEPASASSLPVTGDPAVVALPVGRPTADGSRIAGGGALGPAEPAPSPTAANPVSAEGQAQLAADDAPLPPAPDKGAAELSRPAGEAEFKLPGTAREGGTNSGQSSGGQSTQGQAGASATLDGGLRGLGGGANRGGLDGGHQPGAMPELYQDPEPLPGSVKLRGLRGARLTVPTEDGQTIRARVDLRDEQVDVRLAAPEGTAEQAARRTSELRQALASQGLELGEFEVSTSEHGRADNDSDGKDQGSPDSSGSDPSEQQAPAVDPWGRPIGTENARGSAADGRGSLLDLRL